MDVSLLGSWGLETSGVRNGTSIVLGHSHPVRTSLKKLPGPVRSFIGDDYKAKG